MSLEDRSPRVYRAIRTFERCGATNFNVMAIEVPVRDEASWSYPGWRVVAVCFVLAIFAWAFGFYGQSVYVAKLAELRGWPIATVAPMRRASPGWSRRRAIGGTDGWRSNRPSSTPRD